MKSGRIIERRNLLSGAEIFSMRRKPIKQVVIQEREVVSSQVWFEYLEITERTIIAVTVARADGTEFLRIWKRKSFLTRA